MNFDPENRIVRLCAEGMQLEGEGDLAGAAGRFQEAWSEAMDGFEKCIAAHYVARHQATVGDKLEWDRIALEQALAGGEECWPMLPSLYLNIAKGYEDSGEVVYACEHYRMAWGFADGMPDDGYGRMIRAGIRKGLERVGCGVQAADKFVS